ncbi:alpha/beta hydrolase domain-containing protein [Gordonia rhizosphera]|uniref:Alpha/beta hydrolase domain-containing protein n=1 Tax=Gordonia rhizosphera NBRC 16068 TaxID=1108045 RepID=K6WFY5_9ACTN|nr:alpha/beta hydrolase domain-containing protein [Gordonia rhizosphera]GAB92681.1 hypothetical protein GORHZ_186_00520 [Gordonia rhizosphera NBRC 16068]
MNGAVAFGRLDGGAGCSLIAAAALPDLTACGYHESEYRATGAAQRFTESGAHGVTVVGADNYATRVAVRRPADDASFNGTVVVEWLNVSSGSDAAPEYTYLAEEIVRGGFAWVGVSAQFTGVAGGSGSVGGPLTEPGRGLAGHDPERYGGLYHPGDAYCYDIFGKIGAALRETVSDGDEHPLSGLTVRQVVAVGESQAAMTLTTYANRIAQHHGCYDGILIHSRAAAGTSLGEVGAAIDINAVFDAEPTTIRPDLGIPVFIVQTETDVLSNFRFYRARQPDSDTLRTWEIAGTSHADLHQIGPYEHVLRCPTPVNRGQQRFVLRSALRHLNRWIDGGDPPPTAPPLELASSTAAPAFVTDAIGNVTGGVRTPCVDAPTQILSGIVSVPVPRICALFGSTTPAPDHELRRRYADAVAYVDAYETATDAAISAGFVLTEDRAAIMADARPDLVESLTAHHYDRAGAPWNSPSRTSPAPRSHGAPPYTNP